MPSEAPSWQRLALALRQPRLAALLTEPRPPHSTAVGTYDFLPHFPGTGRPSYFRAADLRVLHTYFPAWHSLGKAFLLLHLFFFSPVLRLCSWLGGPGPLHTEPVLSPCAQLLGLSLCPISFLLPCAPETCQPAKLSWRFCAWEVSGSLGWRETPVVGVGGTTSALALVRVLETPQAAFLYLSSSWGDGHPIPWGILLFPLRVWRGGEGGSQVG